MKNKILFGTMLALLLVGSVSFADDDADKKRLLEEYDRMQEEKAKEQPQTTAEVVSENGEVVTTEGEQVAVAPKKAEKDMTESERMDVEVQRIKKRMLEINDKIENYNKTNEIRKKSKLLKKERNNMKKLAILLGVLSLVACTDQKVVNYNTARLDVIEDYLRNHKYVKPSENLDKLIEEGKIEYAEEYVSLEKEAKQWEREKTQQQQ